MRLEAESRKATLMEVFIISAGAILAITGLLKILGATGKSRILDTTDLVFLISYRSLFVATGVLEVAVALLCFFCKGKVLRASVLAWLASGILIYRLLSPMIATGKPCPCLGTVTDALHVDPLVADNVMKLVLTYLCIGSYAVLVAFWMRRLEEAGNGATAP